ncbi:MAG: V-type ATP synthase subunit F [Candidatus Altiarchaeota archaeon]
MIYFGDRLNTVGLRLAGLKKVFTSDAASIKTDITKHSDEDAIVLVSNSLFTEAEKEIEELRKNGKIVVSIPDETGGGEEIIQNLIKQAVGFEIKSG